MKTKIIHQRIFYLIAFTFFIGASGRSQINSKLPILIIATNTDFGTYTAEILKTEGFNEFIMDSISSGKITPSYLKQFALIILAECQIQSTSKEIFTEYVKEGGNLIAFRPDKSISELFGITPVAGSIDDGYIAIVTKSDQGKGITPEIMQFHGTADKYSVSGAKLIAKLFADQSSENHFPGVVSNNYGKGHSIAFLYNLPKSIVYTRQGNPLHAGSEKDGILGIRAMDLFTDGWVDTSKNTINQADQQMTIMSHCIQSFNSKPLPRFWHFPGSLNCLVVLDSDGEDSNETDFEPQFRDIDSLGAKMTLYIKDVDKVSKGWVDKWVDKGFEIAAHPDDTKEAESPTWNRMDSVIGNIKEQITTKYGLTLHTNVNHWFVWCGKNADGIQDFAAQARIEEKHGIEMDGNYAHYDNNSNQGKNYLGPLGINHGNFTGSGLVMKFADAEGKTVNVYQRFNAVYDQQYMERKAPDDFFYCFKGLMDRSLNDQIYSVISIKAHNNEYFFSKEPLMKMLNYANHNGIPVWTAKNLLDFLKMKDEATFNQINWSDNTLTFELVSSLQHSSGLTFLLPRKHLNTILSSIAVNEQNQPLNIQKIKGSEYSLVTVHPGQNYRVSASYR